MSISANAFNRFEPVHQFIETVGMKAFEIIENPIHFFESGHRKTVVFGTEAILAFLAKQIGSKPMEYKIRVFESKLLKARFLLHLLVTTTLVPNLKP
ncbi:hypothetical protein L1887_03350 [Cichorium endivia]|nr:hypothetical protein L1887_03350 [Cichorium endivia]